MYNLKELILALLLVLLHDCTMFTWYIKYPDVDCDFELNSTLNTVGVHPFLFDFSLVVSLVISLTDVPDCRWTRPC